MKRTERFYPTLFDERLINYQALFVVSGENFVTAMVPFLSIVLIDLVLSGDNALAGSNPCHFPWEACF